MTTPVLARAAVVSGDDPLARDGSVVGAKAAGLAEASRHGARVPTFTVLTADGCERVLAPVSDDIAAHVAGLDPEDAASLRTTAAAIRALVVTAPVPEDVRTALDAHVDALGSGDRFAVRASALGDHSFAGQLEARLDVGRAQLEGAVLWCLASAYSERALFYRARVGIGNDAVQAGVIVQVLVDAAVAGVAFTCNPQSGDRGEAVVAAGLGLGAGVASATADCDTYFVDVASRRVTARVVQEKATRTVAADGGGTAVEPVSGEESEASALTDAQVADVVAVALGLAERAGVPQDVEWAIDRAGTLHVLQARSITATGSHQTILDNVNVTESYPGITLPLSFSFVRRCYREIFRNCQRDFGATAKMAEDAETDLFPYLLGFVHGRVYYNISNWYRMFLAVPGLERAIPAWEAALGIENRYSRPAAPRRGLARVRLLFWELRTVFVVVSGWLRLRGRVRRFFGTYDRFRAELDSTPPSELDGHELLAHLDRYMGELLPLYSVQIFNDFLAQQLFDVVAVLIERWELGDDPVALRNELFCGEAGVDSVDPVRSALDLAQAVRADDDLRALFEGDEDAVSVWETLASEARFATFHRTCLDHIRSYGDRTLEELKLETDPLTERPHDLVPMLRNYLRGGQNVDEMEARERRIRRGAERRVRAALRSRPGRRALFAFVLRHARWGVKQRENLRLGRSRCFGFAKSFYRALGVRLAEADLTDEPRDVFWLTCEEVEALTMGTFVDGDARRLIAGRMADYDRWRDERLPSRIVASGLVAAHTAEADFTVPDDAPVLEGVGCSPGRVSAPAMTLTEPDGSVEIDGEILVAAATDPGWVFLMVAAGGLVSEKGSVLSHTAIIGRELGIPTVVGVEDATRRLEGRTVELDGTAGTVTILAEAAP